MRAATSRRSASGSASAPTTSSSSSRRTTATSSSTSSARASRSSASIRRRTSPRRPRSGACRRSSTFFGARDGRAARRRGQAREPRRRQQRARAGARPERLRRRREDPARAATAPRRSSSRTSCGCSTGSSTTRSTTSTSRTSPSRRSSRSSPRTGSSVYDVEELPTHGGSLRVYAQHADGPHAVDRGRRRAARRARRRAACARRSATQRFAERGQGVEARAARAARSGCGATGKQVVGYGAPGKGNTLLNYCGIRTDLLDYTVDRNPYKHGLFTPGHAHPDPPARADRRDPARLRPRPALEPRSTRSREQLAYVARVGRAADRPDPARDGVSRRPAGGATREIDGIASPRSRPMKVVIFCGGLGVRMGEDDAAHPEADDPDRRPADPLAHHEVLRRLGAHRLHALPRLQGGVDQGVLPRLQRGALERLRALERRQRRRAARPRHLRLEDHVRRHRARRRPSASGCVAVAAASRRRRVSSSRPTATASPTRRSTT